MIRLMMGCGIKSDELSLAVEECVIASAWKKPESVIFSSPEIYKLVNAAMPYEFMNGVYRTRLESPYADAEIDRHHLSFKENKISFRWYVFPHSKPIDLDSRIQKLRPASVTEMQGLYIETDQASIQLPERVTVEELSDSNLEDYMETNIAGWNQTGAGAARMRGEIRIDFARSDRGYRAFLAKYDGVPASTGLIRIVNGVGYFYGGSTRPDLRGKGAYRGLVAYRSKILRDLSIKRAFVLARTSTSAPICCNLGFKMACECRSYDVSF